MPDFASGQHVTAAAMNRRGMPYYARRDSSRTGSSSSTSVGALRMDSISIVSGRAYVINLSCHPSSTVLTDNFRGDIRGSTSGTATASSSVLPGGRFFTDLGGPLTWRFTYIAATTGSLSILACSARDAGSGSCNFFADGTNRITELWVEDMGVVTDTGVDV